MTSAADSSPMHKKHEPNGHLDVKRAEELTSHVAEFQTSGSPPSPAYSTRGNTGKHAVKFSPGFAVNCESEEEAKALALKLNEAIRPLVAPFLARYLGEIEKNAGDAKRALLPKP